MHTTTWSLPMRGHPGDALALIPKAVVLSIRNASAALLLHEMVSAGCSAAAALNLAVAHERSLGARSRWAVYFQSLPQSEPLPLLWSDDELQLLGPTGLAAETRARRDALLLEYHDIRRYILARETDCIASLALIQAPLASHPAPPLPLTPLSTPCLAPPLPALHSPPPLLATERKLESLSRGRYPNVQSCLLHRRGAR